MCITHPDGCLVGSASATAVSADGVNFLHSLQLSGYYHLCQPYVSYELSFSLLLIFTPLLGPKNCQILCLMALALEETWGMHQVCFLSPPILYPLFLYCLVLFGCRASLRGLQSLWAKPWAERPCPLYPMIPLNWSAVWDQNGVEKCGRGSGVSQAHITLLLYFLSSCQIPFSPIAHKRF